MITAKLINNLLNHHPYYSKLTEYQKIVVLNIALTKYYEVKEKVIVHSVYSDGHIGIDDSVIANDYIKKLPQYMLFSKSLSKYKKTDINLSNTDYLKQFTPNERLIIYQIALSKVSKLIPESYSIETATESLSYSIAALLDSGIQFNYGLYYSPVKELYSQLDIPISKYGLEDSASRKTSVMQNLQKIYILHSANILEPKLNNIIYTYFLSKMEENIAYMNNLNITYKLKTSIDEPDDEIEFTVSMPLLEKTYSLSTS